jgi:hypothetical protein
MSYSSQLETHINMQLCHHELSEEEEEEEEG